MSHEIGAGSRFGEWTVAEAGIPTRDGRGVRRRWVCKCSCGTIKSPLEKHLVSGASTNCGCVRKKTLAKVMTTHGGTAGGGPSKAYRTWIHIKKRCENPSSASYQNYGARGIRVCERWQNFENFLADMGEPPDGMSIDRIDNDKGYEPGNCRWATRTTQARNRRNVRMITIGNETKSLRRLADAKGRCRRLIYARIRNGWSHEDAVMTPARKMIGKYTKKASL